MYIYIYIYIYIKFITFLLWQCHWQQCQASTRFFPVSKNWHGALEIRATCQYLTIWAQRLRDLAICQAVLVEVRKMATTGQLLTPLMTEMEYENPHKKRWRGRGKWGNDLFFLRGNDGVSIRFYLIRWRRECRLRSFAFTQTNPTLLIISYKTTSFLLIPSPLPFPSRYRGIFFFFPL